MEKCVPNRRDKIKLVALVNSITKDQYFEVCLTYRSWSKVGTVLLKEIKSTFSICGYIDKPELLYITQNHIRWTENYLINCFDDLAPMHRLKQIFLISFKIFLTNLPIFVLILRKLVALVNSITKGVDQYFEILKTLRF